MKKGMVFTLVLILALAGCAAFKTVTRTILNVATDLCWIAAEEHPDKLGGMTPAAWCAIAENVNPFIQEILAAKQAASDLTGMSSEDDLEETWEDGQDVYEE